ncbi:MAG: hypothetical protein JKY27_03395 [Magnetovibrio sp.]|nr:hypothetical protein [Magnetovibrio sp.]
MSKTIKIVRTDQELECPVVDEKLRALGADLVLLPDGVDEDVLVAEVRDADLVLMCYTPITRRVIESAPNLKGIVKYGVGIDAIDIEAAKDHRVPVVNIPEYAEETVAEGAFTMMIALAKKLVPLHNAMQSEGWAWPQAKWMGSDIAGKTVGLIGCGRIGRSMARMAGVGFRARVIAYDPNISATDMAAIGVEKVDDLHDMLGQADFVTVHSVLTPQSRGLMDAAAFAAMKPTAFFLNVSRGAIVDELAMLEALKSGQIAGAGLDVFNIEPMAHEGHPLSELYALDNVILMPHLTFYTQDAMRRLEEETIERCLELLEGKAVLIKSKDPRLTAQTSGVVLAPG